MKKISFLVFLTLNICLSAFAQTDWLPVTNEARPFTRWWWLGSDVDSLNLTYNLESLAAAGVGGVEITPIYGVKGRSAHYINYLTPKWMQMLGFVESETARLSMKTDMNTGTGWPFGGPEISIEEAATKAIFQYYYIKEGETFRDTIRVQDEKQRPFATFQKIVAFPEGDPNGVVVDMTEQVQKNGYLTFKADNGYTLIALFVGKTLQKVKRAAPGGEGYVMDHFSKEVVKKYLQKYDHAFAANKTPYPATFFNDSYEVYDANWTPDFLAQFEKRRGYKLEMYFRELLARGVTETSRRVITDFRQTMGELLLENFTEQWTAWAHSKGAITRNQAHGSPANLIDVYAAVDIPECETFGISDFDIAGMRKDPIRKENDGDPTTLKFASSAAHIAGKKYTSSETFTWLTEHFRTSWAQCKPEIDQIFTSGVNHVFFHGSAYSPREAAWPGWKFYASIDMSHTNPLWRDAPAFFTYITRVQTWLQSGQPDNDFLLYLPIYDMWDGIKGNFYTAFSIHGLKEKLPEFYRAVEEIRNSGYDLDYISDKFMQNVKIENGLLKTEGGATYKALILPAVRLIPVETMEKIKTLAQAGATVIFAENYPQDVPGLANLETRRTALQNLCADFSAENDFTKTKEIAANQYNTASSGKYVIGANYTDLLARTAAASEVAIVKSGLQYIRRKTVDGNIYFVTMLTNKQIDGWIALGSKVESAMIFDPMTGKKGQANIRQNGGKSEIYLQLKAGQSLILRTCSTQKISAEKWAYLVPTNKVVVVDKNWKLTFQESQPAVKEEFKLNELGSWTDLSNDVLKQNMGTGRYSTTLKINKLKDKRYVISLGEVRESARLFLNGKEVATLFAAPFEADITDFLKNGANRLVIDVTNLPANRIAEYDRQGIEWRIFNEINFVDLFYKGSKYGGWEVMPSGLLGEVKVTEMSVK